MSNEIVKQTNNSLQQFKFNPEQVELIKNIYCKGLTNDEIKLFIAISERTGLDPFSRQIYAIKRWNSKLGKEIMTIQTGIDGFRLIADRTGLYMGTSDVKFEFDKNGDLIKSSITVHKWNEKAQQKCDFTATSFLIEYKPDNDKNGKENPMWRKMPRVMLEKCAEAKALRKAFPQELSGIYEQSEMDQAIDNSISITENEPEKSIKKEIKTTKRELTKEQIEYKDLYNMLLGLCKEMVDIHKFTQDEVKRLVNSLGKSTLKDYDIHGLMALKDVLMDAITNKLPSNNTISLEDDDINEDGEQV